MFASARVLFRAPIDGQTTNPQTHNGLSQDDNDVYWERGLCSEASSGRWTTACVSSPKGWAVLQRPSLSCWQAALCPLDRFALPAPAV